MTDLLSRPAPGLGRTPEPARRPLGTAGAMAGASAAAVSLVICMAVAVIGWFLADAGAHGDTTDALRVGADGWLLGHGARLTAGTTPIGLAPLGLTLVLVAVAFRCGRWASRPAEPPTNDRALASATAVAVAVYLTVLVVVLFTLASSGTNPSLPRALLGGLAVSGLGCGAGIGVGSGRWAAWSTGLPAWLRNIAAGGVAAVLVTVAASAVLVAVALARSLNDASTLMTSLHLGAGDAVMMLGITALLAPNLVLYGAAYLLGPGFALGTGTVVSTTQVSLGALPAFPPLAARPANGTPPGWTAALMAVPPLAAAVGSALAQRRYSSVAWDSAALRGFGAGLAGALLLTVAVGLAGGPMGTGRMALVGAPVTEVMVTAVGGMSMGGMLGALVMAAVQRYRARR